ncbi:MAG: hypothetical protein ACYCTL_08630 [Acidimicrobiales bacterium]
MRLDLSVPMRCRCSWNARRASTIAVSLLALGLVLAACTGSPVAGHSRAALQRAKAAGVERASTPSSAAAGDPNPPASKPPALALSTVERSDAARINLTIGDFPAGWRAAPGNASGSGSLPACSGLDRIALTSPVASPEYGLVTGSASAGTATAGSTASAGTLFAGSSVMFAKDPAAAGQLVTILGDPSTLACIRHSASAATSGGSSLATVARVDVSVPGVRSVAFAVIPTGVRMPYTLRAVIFSKGSAVVEAIFGGSGEAFPTALEQALLGELAARA